jgi:hypothetical protein
VLLEEGVREGLREIGDERRVLVARKGVEIELEDLRELDEEACTDPAPILRDEVEVAR